MNVIQKLVEDYKHKYKKKYILTLISISHWHYAYYCKKSDHELKQETHDLIKEFRKNHKLG